MTRIATAFANTSAIQDLQRTQRDLFDIQRQTSSGKEANDVKGFGRETRTLVSLERFRATNEGHLEAAEGLNIRLSLQDTHLERGASVISQFQLDLTEALTLNDFSRVEAITETVFSELKSVFNSQHNGRFNFSGTVFDTAPIQADDLADLAANPIINAIEQDGETQRIRVDDNRLIEAAPLARDAATEIFTILRDLKIFNDGPGPFTANPTPAEQTEIQNTLGRLSDAYDNILIVQARNGQNLNETDQLITRHESEETLLAQLSGGITDVDLGEVAVRLNIAQTQYQASASVFSRIQGLSLLDVL